MLTKKVKKRASFLSLFLVLSFLAVFFTLKSLTSNILYFKSPTDIKLSQEINLNRKIRVGGMVKDNSLDINNNEIKFIVTDFQNELFVSYSGTVPSLFSEGKGVVAEGRLQDRNFFIADRILAKHDEKYMPPELKGLFKKMLSNIGNSILFLSVFLSLSIIYCSIKNLKSIDNRIDKNIYQLCLLQSTFVIISFFTLVAGFLTSDFSLISVYQNSHTLKPTLYKIAGTWGNHEGSLLLWVLILTLFSYFF